MPKAVRGPGCQIMYLGGTTDQSVEEALATVHGTPVLTVTGGGAALGIVDFALVQGRERYRIDDQGASENGLGISPKLLALALSARPRADTGSRP
jgi:hypothetical protein